MYFNMEKENKEWKHRNTMLLIEKFYKEHYKCENSLRFIAMELMTFYMILNKEENDKQIIDCAANEIASMIVENETKGNYLNDVDKNLVEIEIKTAYTNLYELCLLAATLKLDNKSKIKSK